MSKLLQVGEAAQALGLNPQTLYFYERIGLVPSPRRTASGYRLYSPQDMTRLSFITRAKSLGLSLEDIKDILLLQEGKSPVCQAIHDRLTAKVKQIDEQILQLQTLREDLLPLVERCQANLNRPTPANECVVLEEMPHEAKNSPVG